MSERHIPVLLKEVLDEFDSLNLDKANVLDCTLGQAGHSIELFNRIKSGVLLSIDLNKESIEWVGKTFGAIFNDQYSMINYQKIVGDKKWILAQGDFAEIEKIAQESSLEKFDFILADLGFSNFELSQNLGISFKQGNQALDMRYKSEGLKASDILNEFSTHELANIFAVYGDVADSKNVANTIANSRAKKRLEKVSDLVFALKKYPDSIRTKVFQALRTFVNQEEERLEKLTRLISNILSDSGTAVFITFNHREEEILKKNLKDLRFKEPNITEIINNQQSRSAKLYIYKSKRTSN